MHTNQFSLCGYSYNKLCFDRSIRIPSATNTTR